MTKKIKWALLSFLSAVMLVGCGTDVEPEEPVEEEEEITEIERTKEGVIEWLNKYFGDYDNMTPFGMTGDVTTVTYTDSTKTEVSSSSSRDRRIEVYGSSDFLYKYYYNSTYYTDNYTIYKPFEIADGVVVYCRESVGISYYDYDNTFTFYDTPVTNYVHYCSNTYPPYAYDTTNMHARTGSAPFSLYPLTDGEDAEFSLSQYEWEEVGEASWEIVDYDLWNYIYSGYSVTYTGSFNYPVNISVNDGGNLVITATIGRSSTDEILTLELIEVGDAVSKTIDDINTIIEEGKEAENDMVRLWFYESLIGSDVSYTVYTKESEDAQWVSYSTSSGSYHSPGTIVGFSLSQSGSTLTNVYINQEEYSELELDEENGIYYFTMPVHDAYVTAEWTN